MKKLTLYGIIILILLPLWIFIDSNESKNEQAHIINIEGIFYNIVFENSHYKFTFSYPKISSLINGMAFEIFDDALISVILLIFILHIVRLSTLSKNPNIASFRLISLSIIMLLMSIKYLNLNIITYLRSIFQFPPRISSRYYFVGPIISLILGTIDFIYSTFLFKPNFSQWD